MEMDDKTCGKKKGEKYLSRADARELDDACRILRNFQRKRFFQIFRPSRLSENSALILDCDDTPESASKDCVQRSWGGEWVGGYPTR